MKHLVIRHDGNGIIRAKDFAIEDLTPTDIDEGRYFDDDYLVCYIPLKTVPLAILKQIISIKEKK